MNSQSNFYKKVYYCCIPLFCLFLIKAQANGIQFIETDLKTAQSIAAKEDKLFFIYYGADWCMPCKWMEENTFLDFELSTYVNQNYIAVKANVSSAIGAVLKQQFDVANIPSILVFAATGKLIGRKTSSLDAVFMQKWLRNLDYPQNHLSKDATLEMVMEVPSLDSPNANVHFKQAPLIPDDSPYALISQLEEERLIFQEPAVAIVPQNFAPRSSLYYGIKLSAPINSYQEGVRTVISLEKKHQHKVELYPEANNQYSILIGHFKTTGEANNFLRYLNRNDISGKVVNLPSATRE